MSNVPRTTSGKLTAEQEVEICRRYEAGETAYTLDAAFSVSSTTIYNVLKRHNIQRRPSANIIQLSSGEQTAIRERYQAGESGYELASALSVSSSSVYNFLKSQGIKRRPLNIFTEGEERALCKRYEAGETTRSIANDYDVRVEFLWHLFKRRGIETRSRGEFGTKYYCDHHFFDRIDTEEKAYILGFIAADGYIHNVQDVLKIALQPEDREHLVRIKYALKSTHPITDFSSHSTFHGRTTTLSTISIGSSSIVRALESHGVGRAKTFTVSWPHHLAPELTRHFLRGAVDGDGSLFYKAYRRPRGWLHLHRFSLIGSYPFITDCQHYLVQACGLNYTKLEQHRNSPGIATVKYTGKTQVGRIFHLLYDDANILMPRKYYALAFHFPT